MNLKEILIKLWAYRRARLILFVLFSLFFLVNLFTFIRLRITDLIPQMVFLFQYPTWILYTEMLLSLIGLEESFELLSAKKLFTPLIKIITIMLVIVIIQFPR